MLVQWFSFEYSDKEKIENEKVVGSECATDKQTQTYKNKIAHTHTQCKYANKIN